MKGFEKREYSEAFKQTVVEAIESGKCESISEACAEFGVGSGVTVKRWLERYGSGRKVPRRIRVERVGERSKVRQLKERIRELEQALIATQVDNVLNQAYFEVLCEEKGIRDVASYKKKLEPKLSAQRRRSGGSSEGSQ